MKNYGWLVLVIAVSLSCSNAKSSVEPGRRIEGTYVHHGENEFGEADDTIVISAIKNQRNLYAIERHVGYSHRVNKGKRLKGTKSESAIGIWEADVSQLREQKYGRVYFPSEDGKQLLMGTAFYTRIAGR